MCDIHTVASVLKHIFAFLSNQIRSEIAERLKDGDITDEECRRLFVRELDDIKSKMDGLARKDLVSSLCFLQEGINGLYQSLSQINENTAESTEEDEEQATLPGATSGMDNDPKSIIDQAVAFMNAIASLKICSNDRFVSAIKSFELAREKATEAFCNEALSIEDRIQATQIRMMARILEKLEDPDASVSYCLQYLKQLHDIETIKKIFSVLIDGGIKSRFNKTKRLDNAWSVQDLNQILFQFAKKFTKSSLLVWLSQWPKISLDRKTYHPVFGEDQVFQKLKEAGLQVMLPYSVFKLDRKVIVPFLSTLNNKGETIAMMQRENTFKIFKPSGENHTLFEVPCRDKYALLCGVATMDIDAEGNIHVIIRFQERKSDDQLWSFELFIFDENGEKKLESPLPFQQSSPRPKVCMAVSKNSEIAILDCQEKILHIGNKCMKANSFKVDKTFSLKELSIGGCLSYVKVLLPDSDGTKVIAADNYTLYIYTGDGQLERKIEIPEGHKFIDSVAINHVTKCILVKTYHQTGNRGLLIFSETGKLKESLVLGSSKWICFAELTSHCSSPVALVGKTGAILLQV